jgi:hypothetical protein
MARARVGRLLNLDKTYYGEDLVLSERIWIEENPSKIIYCIPQVNVLASIMPVKNGKINPGVMCLQSKKPV